MTRRTRAKRMTAISLTGGAALSLLGAPAAFAGDADSTGNSSSTDHTQSLQTEAGSDPSFTAVGGGVSNNGVAASNTGVVAGEAINVQTGNAHSAGNESTSQLDQAARISATGGGTTLLSQHAFILNAGGAYADTGFNAGDGITTGNAWALGNSSHTSVKQWANIADEGGALRLVNQGAAVLNLGAAIAETGFNVGETIDTGNAKATGDIADTSLEQSADTSGTPTGPIITNQNELTTNAGLGLANTGFNEATGDDSTNDPEED